jgi:hypothetical protein
VVGGLVEQQQVGLGQQQLAERHPATLAAGQVRDGVVRRRAAQRVHRLLQLRVQVPRVRVVQRLLQPAHLLHQLVGVVGGHQLCHLVEPVELDLDVAEALLDVAAHGLVFVQPRLLLQDAHTGAGRQHGVAVVGGVQPGHDPQDARLAGPVRADDADLRAGKEVQTDVVKDHLVAVRLADLPHRVDEFGHCRGLAFPKIASL